MVNCSNLCPGNASQSCGAGWTLEVVEFDSCEAQQDEPGVAMGGRVIQTPLSIFHE